MKNIKLSFLQKVRIKLFGRIEVRREKRKGWSKFLPIYIFFCRKCKKYVEDYEHGYNGRLDCPNCA